MHVVWLWLRCQPFSQHHSQLTAAPPTPSPPASNLHGHPRPPCVQTPNGTVAKQVFFVDWPLAQISLSSGVQYFITVQGSNDAGGCKGGAAFKQIWFCRGRGASRLGAALHRGAGAPVVDELGR